MKKWFLNLSSKQRKNVYVISIIVSVVMFYGIALTVLFVPLWAGALAAVILERKIIKEQNQKDNEIIAEKAETETVPEGNELMVEKAETETVPEGNELMVEKAEAETIQDERAKERSSEQIAPSVGFTITVETEYVEREPVGELSHLDFGKPAGELGCFLNYEPSKLYPPSEKQLQYLKDLGVFIPDGITNVDASCMISRATGEDSAEGPSPSLVSLALGLKTEFSAFIGASGLLFCIIGQASGRDRAALYAYGVQQSMRGCSFGNMLDAPDLAKFYAFADQVLAAPSLIRSLENRTADDYLNPYKGTAIYKAAAAYLASGSIANNQ